MNKEEMESAVTMICTVLKGLLEETGLYIAVDKKTKEFVFIERESFDRGDSRCNNYIYYSIMDSE